MPLWAIKKILRGVYTERSDVLRMTKSKSRGEAFARFVMSVSRTMITNASPLRYPANIASIKIFKKQNSCENLCNQ